MRFSQPKQIVKTPGEVQSYACYRKINDISIDDFSQTRNTIPRSIVQRGILCFYDVFPYPVLLSITDISQLLIGLDIFFDQEKLDVNFIKGSVFKITTKGVRNKSNNLPTILTLIGFFSFFH